MQLEKRAILHAETEEKEIFSIRRRKENSHAATMKGKTGGLNLVSLKQSPSQHLFKERRKVKNKLRLHRKSMSINSILFKFLLYVMKEL